MPMRLASEAQASDLKMEQKDRARFDRKVAFFATAAGLPHETGTRSFDLADA